MTTLPCPLLSRSAFRRSRRPRSPRRPVVVLAFLLALAGASTGVMAEVWGYVDDQGATHLSPQKTDARYQLFFRGDLVDEAEPTDRSQLSPPSAPGALAAGAALQRLNNDGNAQRYQSLIEEHAARQDLDPALVKALIAAESAFQPAAISPKGARGLMQVMPETAARYGVVGDRKQSAARKLLDPALNLRIGTQYLRDLLGRFSNDLVLALAAYNAGEMAVVRYHNRVPPYPETVEYVKRVQGLYAVLRPPAREPPEPVGRAVPRKRISGSFVALPTDRMGEPPGVPVLADRVL
ncbi:MAG: lytic transglycosylase domain-containing protein [Betaproteobacteria bacterium]